MTGFRNILMGAAGVGGNKVFKDIIDDASLATNLKLCLDAGDENSYSGSGTKWLDTAGSGYDFFRGSTNSASTDDPTFNGTAGDISDSEYWSFDGGDYFQYDTSNESWMNNLHKDNADFTIATFLYTSGGLEGGICGTMAATWANVGFNLILTTSNTINFRVARGAHSPEAFAGVTSTTALNTSAWNFVAISIDEATGSGGGFFYQNGAYNQVSSSDTFNAAYSSPSSSSATYAFNIGAVGNGAEKMQNTIRMGGLMIWEGGALTKANLDTLWAEMRGRYNL
tara:strand:- start:779 stop:1624 length:846 start_codon:yes stop_codon:yes gene_type:complete